VLQMEGEPFLQMFSSTGPFEGVLDDVDLEDTPAKQDLCTVQLGEAVAEGDAGNVEPSSTHTTPESPLCPDSAPRNPLNSSHGAKSDTDSVRLPFPSQDLTEGVRKESS
jgi:hypothetical protein